MHLKYICKPVVNLTCLMYNCTNNCTEGDVMVSTKTKVPSKNQDKIKSDRECNFSLQPGSVKPFNIPEMTGSKSGNQADSTSKKED